MVDVRRIELFRSLFHGVHDTLHHGQRLIRPCVTDALIEEDCRQVSEDFLIGALDGAVLLLGIRRGKRVIRTNESREFSDQLVVECSPSIRVYCCGSAESTEMLEQTGICLICTDTRRGEELNPPRESVNDDEYIRIPFIIGFEGTNVIQM